MCRLYCQSQRRNTTAHIANAKEDAIHMRSSVSSSSSSSLMLVACCRAWERNARLPLVDDDVSVETHQPSPLRLGRMMMTTTMPMMIERWSSSCAPHRTLKCFAPRVARVAGAFCQSATYVCFRNRYRFSSTVLRAYKCVCFGMLVAYVNARDPESERVRVNVCVCVCVCKFHLFANRTRTCSLMMMCCSTSSTLWSGSRSSATFFSLSIGCWWWIWCTRRFYKSEENGTPNYFCDWFILIPWPKALNNQQHKS